jgi:hypothetical protein
MADRDTLADEREAFELAYEAESENREVALESLRFSRLGEQWPDKIKRERELDGRPVLTINKMPSFIRQVVNDSRMNRPQIKIKGVDDNSDPATAQVIEGLIRNIEYVSKADTAYDTAVDCAASMGWGYIRIAVDYEYDDSFDKGLRIRRVANPFSVYGDPFSAEADSSDWNQAHVVEYMKKDAFSAKYKGAEKVDWSAAGYDGLDMPWRDDEQILVCEAWRREIVDRTILLLSTGQVVGEKEFAAAADFFAAMGVTVQNQRKAKSFKITQRILTGAEVLEENEWAGQYIPVIPVYGEEFNIEGKRMFRSLVHNGMDAQRMFNYWRTQATEMVALAPRVPYIGEEGSFDSDPNWETANSKSHPYLMYKKGGQMPQRQPLDGGSSIGAMSEAMAASDDMKAIIGMYDASLGQRSNETSGKAIMARQREGDVSTFHFIDNLSRAIRHVGCCLVDLIPKTYSSQKIIRVLGEDGKERVVKLGQQPEQDANGPMPDGAERIYDLSVGRYDVAVSSGPGFTTKREEAAMQMTEFIRSYPAAAPVIGDLLVKALDWPQADEIADRLKAMMPQQAKGGLPPELQQMIEEGKNHIAQLEQELQQMKAEKALSEKQNKIALAGKDLEIQQMRGMKAMEDMAEKVSQGVVMETQPVQQQSPISVNVPENIGESVANAIVPAVTRAVVDAVASLPPLQVQMPPPQRMRRRPVRDENGMIIETVDEPIIEGLLN